MLLDLALLAVALAIGVQLQRRLGGAELLRERVWSANYVVMIPLAAVYAFLSVEVDRSLLATLACGLVAWWATVLIAWLYARAAAPGAGARERSLRGALLVIGAFPNTGFVGFPLANLAFGADGLRLAVIYDQVSLVVPAIVVGVLVARRHTGRTVGRRPGEAPRSLAREVLVSPPLWTVALLVTVRLVLVRDPVDLAGVGSVIGHVVGPVGFLLLGLSVPLEGFSHGRREVAQAAGASLVRIAVAPALLAAVAATARVDVPAPLYLVASMPTAFHALVVSRLHDMHASVVRLGVLMTTTVVVLGTIAGVLVLQ